jgi:hypothetical protein
MARAVLLQEISQHGGIVGRELADKVFANVCGGFAVDGGDGLIEFRMAA